MTIGEGFGGGGLAPHMAEIARALLGLENKAKSTRTELRWGSKGSLSVDLVKGVWHDHEAGEGGYAPSLVRRHVGSEPGAVARWLDDFGLGRAEPGTVRRQSAPRIDAPSAEDELVRQRARRIWREASHCLAGTPAEAYLRSRGIWEPGRNAKLRFARLAHPNAGEVLSAIIVPRVDVGNRQLGGVQRIFLTEAGEKYRSGTCKMSLGRGTLIAPLFDPAECLGLAEGVETALSVALLIGGPAWAMCGGFPASLEFPWDVRRVVIVADHDAPSFHPDGRPKARSLQRAKVLAKFLRERGLVVDVVMPEPEGADANDVIGAAGVVAE